MVFHLLKLVIPVYLRYVRQAFYVKKIELSKFTIKVVSISDVKKPWIKIPRQKIAGMCVQYVYMVFICIWF